MKPQEIFLFALTALSPLAASASAIDDTAPLHSPGGLPVHEGSLTVPLNDLSLQEQNNQNLGSGLYGFAQWHDASVGTFFDSWRFTLAENSNVTLSLHDVEIPFDLPAIPGATNTNAFDNHYLTLSVFDADDHWLGSIGDNGTLKLSDLVAMQWYTVTVSAKVSGLLGGFYYGALAVGPVQAVPLGDSLPLFGSALAVLIARKKMSRKTVSRRRQR